MAQRKSPTKAEAIKLLRSHPRTAPVLGGGGEIVTVEPERGRGSGDRLVVGIYDHEQGKSLVALVDPNGVVGVHETPAKFQLSDKERELAEELVGEDIRVNTFLRRRRMNPLTRLYFPPSDTSGHRHAIVFVRPSSSERLYPVVDLTDRKVVDVLGEADLTRGVGG